MEYTEENHSLRNQSFLQLVSIKHSIIHTFNHSRFLCSEAPPLSTPLCKGHKTRRFAQATSMQTLRHHLSSKPEKFRFIQRLGEYISNLMIGRAVFEFHFFVDNLLLQETKSHFIMLRVPQMFDPRICLSNTSCVIFRNFQRLCLLDQFKVL